MVFELNKKIGVEFCFVSRLLTIDVFLEIWRCAVNLWDER